MIKYWLPLKYDLNIGLPEWINYMKLKITNQRFSLGFNLNKKDYLRVVEIKREKRTTQIEGHIHNSEKSILHLSIIAFLI